MYVVLFCRIFLNSLTETFYNFTCTLSSISVNILLCRFKSDFFIYFKLLFLNLCNLLWFGLFNLMLHLCNNPIFTPFFLNFMSVKTAKEKYI